MGQAAKNQEADVFEYINKANDVLKEKNPKNIYTQVRHKKIEKIKENDKDEEEKMDDDVQRKIYLIFFTFLGFYI